MQAAAFTQKQRMGSSSWLHELAPRAREGWQIPPATAMPSNHNLQLPPLAWQLCQALPPARRPPPLQEEAAVGSVIWARVIPTAPPAPAAKSRLSIPTGSGNKGHHPPPAPQPCQVLLSSSTWCTAPLLLPTQ